MGAREGTGAGAVVGKAERGVETGAGAGVGKEGRGLETDDGPPEWRPFESSPEPRDLRRS